MSRCAVAQMVAQITRGSTGQLKPIQQLRFFLVVRDQEVEGSNRSARPLFPLVRPGHIGDRSYRTHGLHFRAKRVFEGCRVFSSQIDVAEIVLHKADQPNTFFDFLDTDSLTSKDRAEVDFFTVETNAPQLVTWIILSWKG